MIASVSGRRTLTLMPSPSAESISSVPPRPVMFFFTTSVPTPRPQTSACARLAAATEPPASPSEDLSLGRIRRGKSSQRWELSSSAEQTSHWKCQQNLFPSSATTPFAPSRSTPTHLKPASGSTHCVRSWPPPAPPAASSSSSGCSRTRTNSVTMSSPGCAPGPSRRARFPGRATNLFVRPCSRRSSRRVPSTSSPSCCTAPCPRPPCSASRCRGSSARPKRPWPASFAASDRARRHRASGRCRPCMASRGQTACTPVQRSWSSEPQTIRRPTGVPPPRSTNCRANFSRCGCRFRTSACPRRKPWTRRWPGCLLQAGWSCWRTLQTTRAAARPATARTL